MINFIKWLFSSRQERHNMQLQSAHDAQALADKIRVCQDQG